MDSHRLELRNDYRAPNAMVSILVRVERGLVLVDLLANVTGHWATQVGID